jgi:hypothetical protein
MSNHDRDYLELVFLHALRVLPASEIPVLEAHLSACAECRQEMEALRPIVGAALSSGSQRRLGKRRYCHRHTPPVNRTGKKPRPASATKCWRRIHRTTASACSCASRRAPTIRLTNMGESRSCISWTASYGSTTRNSIQGITTGQKLAPPITVCGARPAAPAFSSPPPGTCFADFAAVAEFRRVHWAPVH